MLEAASEEAAAKAQARLGPPTDAQLRSLRKLLGDDLDGRMPSSKAAASEMISRAPASESQRAYILDLSPTMAERPGFDCMTAGQASQLIDVLLGKRHTTRGREGVKLA